MSKEIKNITNTVMDKIHEGKIKMRSRAYFIFGSIFIFVGLVASVLTSIFLIGLMRFFLRSHGPMASYRLEQTLASFPWWIFILVILGLIIGVWLIRRYDFSYKIDFNILLAIFVVAIIVSGWVIDMSGLNDIWFSRGPMPKSMRRYFQENNTRHDSRFDRI